MANRARTLPNYTYDDYVQWEGRWEIIDGIPHAMSPAPTREHQWLTGNIITEFNNKLREQACNCKVFDFIDLKVNETTVVQPDVSIICDTDGSTFDDARPDLVVEVLSPATRQKDLNDKFHIYNDYGIRYYVIVDPKAKTIKVYQSNQNGEYIEMTDFNFEFSSGCKITADLDSIWG